MKACDFLWSLEETFEERGKEYGTPRENFKRIASLWSDWLDYPISEYDVGVMMIMLKISRLKNKHDHIDSFLDIAGYAVATADATHEE
jgi:hypothetical protein